MSFNHNHVTLAGNLTRDPQIRETPTSAVTNFGLAVNRRWRNQQGEQQEETTFVDCEAWGRLGENVAQYLRKGRPAFVEGRLKFDSWEDAQGNRQSRLRVVATNVQFLASGQRRDDNDGPARSPAVASAVAEGPEASYEDEPPF